MVSLLSSKKSKDAVVAVINERNGKRKKKFLINFCPLPSAGILKPLYVIAHFLFCSVYSNITEKIIVFRGKISI